MSTEKRLPSHADAQMLLPRVCELWSEILGQPHLDPDQHFFLAGGDSLQMARLLMRLQAEWGVQLQLAQLWQFSSPRKMAACCSDELVHLHCREPGATRLRSSVDFPASCSQQGLWFSELQADNNGLYNSGVVLQLHGPLMPAVLEQALNALRRQFPLLRGCVRPDAGGHHLRVLIPHWHAIALQTQSLPRTALLPVATSVLAEPFELGLGLWRCRLYRHAQNEHSLLLCCHHCLVDGWSGTVLLQQLARAYNALLADPLWSPTFCDTAFASHCWQQQEFLCSETHADNLQWWKARLADCAPLSATTPWHAQVQHWPYRLRSAHRLWSVQQLHLLQSVCARHEVTLFAALLTALACALAGSSGQQQQVIAFPVAGRILAAEEDSVGCYMNLLPIRLALAADESLPQLLVRVQQEATQVQAHAAPWLSLVQALRPPVLADGNAWTEVVLALQNFPASTASFGQLHCEQLSLPATYGQHVLKFEAAVTAEGLNLQVDYAEAVLPAAVVEELVAGMLSRLQALVVQSTAL